MKSFFPAEWNNQDAIVIAWPTEHTDWHSNLLDTQRTVTKIIDQISDHQKIILLHHQATSYPFRELNDNIHIFHLNYDDTWTRDFIGISTYDNGHPIFNNFEFNAWGNKFKNNNDNKVNIQLDSLLSKNTEMINHSNIILEGGSIESNGNGIVLTTEKCLLNKNRNNNLNKKEIESYLKSTLLIDEIIWLSHGVIKGDDTDAHIDTLARFCNQDTIAYSIDSSSELIAMEEELQTLAQSNSKKFNLIPLPIPNYTLKGKRLPATYTNFLITNNKVLVPVYNKPEDEFAIKQFKSCFNTREVVPINCEALIRQGGSLHCLTMQLPEGFLNLALLS